MGKKTKTDEKIKTVPEFVEWINNLGKKEAGDFMLYRGLADAKWEVQASAARRINKDSSDSSVLLTVFQNYITNLLQEADGFGLGYHDGAELYELELLANLQHHGAATCLIDFTQAPLIALWFACNEQPKKDGKVVAMRTADIKQFKTVGSNKTVGSKTRKDEIIEFFKEDTLWKWQPRDINNRILSQQSIFVFGKPVIEEKLYEAILIPANKKKDILKALKQHYNISETNLFRDLAGFAIANAHDKPYAEYNAEDYFALGVEEHQKGNYQQAIEYYDKAIELYLQLAEVNPQLAEAYYNRGNVKDDLGDHHGAIADYSKAFEINPKYANAYYNRGIAKDNLGKYQDAIADYSTALEINPQFAKAYLNRGVAKSNLDDHQGAIADYTEALEINPQYAKAYLNRGIAKNNLGDHHGAIADCNKALEINPEFAKALTMLAHIKKILQNKN